jgi:hypothetical protein
MSDRHHSIPAPRLAAIMRAYFSEACISNALEVWSHVKKDSDLPHACDESRGEVEARPHSQVRMLHFIPCRVFDEGAGRRRQRCNRDVSSHMQNGKGKRVMLKFCSFLSYNYMTGNYGL